jgi:predicted DCC family thiol-disulfide oxidoreductase YuxK
MNTLNILFDPQCNLCNRITYWLEKQPKYVDLRFIPADSDWARHRFPALDHNATLKELHVISQQGDVYRGAKAWLMCFWALREYREWSLRLASPELAPTARRLITRLSNNRYRFAQYQGLMGDHQTTRNSR